MELSDLNFKQVLVVLTKPNMRIEIINYLKEQEVDLGLKFVDSYMDGAKMVQRLEHDPYDFIIVDSLVNNAKSKDFIEFITEEKKETKILTFSSEEKLNYLK